MTDRYCMICESHNAGDNWNLELSDDKEKVLLCGHKECIDELHIKIKGIKDLNKKSVQKVLKEIGVRVD